MSHLFNVCKNHQRLNYGGRESKKTICSYDSDISVTLKQRQSNKTWYELVETKHRVIMLQSLKTSIEQCLWKSQP